LGQLRQGLQSFGRRGHILLHLAGHHIDTVLALFRHLPKPAARVPGLGEFVLVDNLLKFLNRGILFAIIHQGLGADKQNRGHIVQSTVFILRPAGREICQRGLLFAGFFTIKF